MTKLIGPFKGLPFPTLFSGDIFQDLDRALTDLMGADRQYSNVGLKKGFPKGDIYMNDDGNAVIELALAGYSKDTLSVKVEDNKLVVSATKQDDSETQFGKTLAKREFKKEFHNFTNEWNLAGSTVSYKDGLLQVIVPRVQEEPKVALELEIK